MLLQSLNAVIAFATVMLVLSLMITAVVHAAIAIVGLRGRNLRWGLVELFQRTLPGEDRAALERRAERLAARVLTHPTISTSTNWLMKGLEKLLDSRGEGRFNGGKRPPASLNLNDVKLVLEDLGEAGSLALDRVDEIAGSETAAKLMAALRERLPRQVDEVEAALHAAAAEMGEAGAATRKFEQWFELCMDAAADKLKLHARWVTVGAALVLAFGMRVDSVSLLHELFENPEATAQVLAQTANAQALYASRQGETADGRIGLEELQKTIAEIDRTLAETGLTVFQPFASWTAFRDNFTPWKPTFLEANRGQISGSLMTVLLLSLGAPFWSSVLGKLVGFRGILRKRQDEKD